MEYKLVNDPQNAVRAYPLTNGTIFTIVAKEKEYIFEFEDDLLYEVVFKGYDVWMQSIWERTGKTFTIDEASKLVL